MKPGARSGCAHLVGHRFCLQGASKLVITSATTEWRRCVCQATSLTVAPVMRPTRFGMRAIGEQQGAADCSRETSRRMNAGLARRPSPGCRAYTPPRKSRCVRPVIATTDRPDTRRCATPSRIARRTYDRDHLAVGELHYRVDSEGHPSHSGERGDDDWPAHRDPVAYWGEHCFGPIAKRRADDDDRKQR